MKAKLYILILIIYLTAFYGGILEFIPILSTYRSLLIILTDILITYLGLSSILYGQRSVILGLLAILLISFLNFLSSENSIIAHLNGLREISNLYFLVLFFFRLFNSGYQFYFNQLFKRFVYIYLGLQIPITIIQFIKHGASDNVGGTLGNGSSGILTLSIFVLVYYLIESNCHQGSAISKLKYLLSISYFFIPVFLNETKITFILIPLLFISLINLKQFKSLIIAGLLAGCFLIIFSNLFTSYGQSYDNPMKRVYNQEYLEYYLSGDVRDNIDVPRFTKLILAVKILKRDKFRLYLGQEYGAFKGGTTLKRTHFSIKYDWLLQGSRPYLFYLFISGGGLLVGLLIYLISSIMKHVPYKGFKNYSSGLLLFIFFIFVLILFYNDALRYAFFMVIFFYVLFFSKFFIRTYHFQTIPNEKKTVNFIC